MNIPLIQDVQKDDINTSLIAIKREKEQLASLIATANEKIAELNSLMDTKVNVSDIVNEVTSGNMHSVTSNAVSVALDNKLDVSNFVSTARDKYHKNTAYLTSSNQILTINLDKTYMTYYQPSMFLISATMASSGSGANYSALLKATLASSTSANSSVNNLEGSIFSKVSQSLSGNVVTVKVKANVSSNTAVSVDSLCFIPVLSLSIGAS